MHAIVRTYSGRETRAFADLMEQRKTDVEQVFRSTKGIISYTAVRTSDGVVTLTVGDDKAAVDEAHKRAMAWVKENAAHTKVQPPRVDEGAVLVQLKL